MSAISWRSVDSRSDALESSPSRSSSSAISYPAKFCFALGGQLVRFVPHKILEFPDGCHKLAVSRETSHQDCQSRGVAVLEGCLSVQCRNLPEQGGVVMACCIERGGCLCLVLPGPLQDCTALAQRVEAGQCFPCIQRPRLTMAVEEGGKIRQRAGMLRLEMCDKTVSPLASDTCSSETHQGIGKVEQLDVRGQGYGILRERTRELVQGRHVRCETCVFALELAEFDIPVAPALHAGLEGSQVGFTPLQPHCGRSDGARRLETKLREFLVHHCPVAGTRRQNRQQHPATGRRQQSEEGVDTECQQDTGDHGDKGANHPCAFSRGYAGAQPAAQQVDFDAKGLRRVVRDTFVLQASKKVDPRLQGVCRETVLFGHAKGLEEPGMVVRKKINHLLGPSNGPEGLQEFVASLLTDLPCFPEIQFDGAEVMAPLAPEGELHRFNDRFEVRGLSGRECVTKNSFLKLGSVLPGVGSVRYVRQCLPARFR